jgi:excisionase family DNA binding protein
LALQLGVCTKTIYREINDGKLDAIKIRGQWRISAEEVTRYLAAERPFRLYSGTRHERDRP